MKSVKLGMLATTRDENRLMSMKASVTLAEAERFESVEYTRLNLYRVTGEATTVISARVA